MARRANQASPCRGGHHLAVVLSFDLEASFVHRSVMPSTQQDEIVEPGCAAIGPVPHVMRIAVAGLAPGNAAAPAACGQRRSDSGRNGAGLAADVEDGASLVMLHDDGARVTRHPSRRLRVLQNHSDR